jgi:putative ABC transport system permease protein
VSGWRPALRIARRGVRRSLGRSLLVAVLVGVPVAAATMVDVVARTMFSTERDAEAAMGSADAYATVTAMSSLGDDYRPERWSGIGTGTKGRDPDDVDLAALLPAGSRVVPVPPRYLVGLRVGERGVRGQLVVADVREPLHEHEARLLEGRPPERGDEVLISPALADRLGAGAGSTVTPADGPPLTVTGLAESAFCLSCEALVAAPGSAASRIAGGTLPINLSGEGAADYLVDLPDDVSADALWPGLAEHGVALTPRDAYLHPDRYEQTGSPVTVADLQAAAVTTLIAGLGLLEVVLLAGAAFAVGARRQTRELGLVAASGGSSHHVRRIVLAQGLVLGALGAALGVVVGFLLAFAGAPLWERLEDGRVAGWHFGRWEIAGAALIGVVSGLAAAVVPALGAARMRPVDALAERFRTSRSARRRTAVAGAVLIAGGVLLALAGDRLLADDFAAYAAALEGPGQGGISPPPTPAGPVGLIVGGAALLVAGLVVLVPSAIAGLAVPAARMPLALRLAMRDAARHRHRTGPATSAIAVAVAGSVVVAFLLAGTMRASEIQYVPALPPHVLSVELGDTDAAGVERAARDAAGSLPDGAAHLVREPSRPLEEGELAYGPSDVTTRQLELMPRGSCERGCIGNPPSVAGNDAFNATVAGRPLGTADRKALADGQVLVFDRGLLWPDDRVAVYVSSYEGDGTTVRLPARLVPRETTYTSLPSALIPASVAREHGWEVTPTRALVTYAAAATEDEVEAAMGAAQRFGAVAQIEAGPQSDDEVGLIIAALAAAFITLVGVAISVALSAAEGRADLATLAAVGAPPGRRRALAAGQALLVAGGGSALGVALGAFVAFAARATTGSPGFVVPWANLAVTAVAVPLLAVLVAALFTPSRLPLVRRAT